MRFTGLAYVCAFVAALAAFGLRAEREAPPAVAAPDPASAVVIPESQPPTATEPVRSDEPEATDPAEVSQSQEIQVPRVHDFIPANECGQARPGCLGRLRKQVRLRNFRS